MMCISISNFSSFIFIIALCFQTNHSPRILDIRTELDASQARLAEAQARLLANEAERIQLLRTWQTELMKQSQLINSTGIVFSTGGDGETLKNSPSSRVDQLNAYNELDLLKSLDNSNEVQLGDKGSGTAVAATRQQEIVPQEVWNIDKDEPDKTKSSQNVPNQSSRSQK